MTNFFKICLKLCRSTRAFTLLETMIAVTLLAVAIVAPMSLTAQSLKSAYYARDQITAFYLAQEGLEAVRSVRDGNILKNSQGTTLVDLLQDIPSKSGAPFRIDARNNTMTLCSADGIVCNPLQVDSTLTLYGYSAGWTNTQYTRTLTACFVQTSGACNGGTAPGESQEEAKITVTVSWRTGGLQLRTVNISENLYRWVEDGIAAP